MEENIKEDIEKVKDYIDGWRDSLTDEDGYTKETLDEDSENFIYAIENILADRERLEKENGELTRDNFRLNTELENNRKEYQETYKDVREELKELQAKANKYDSLVEKIKDKINKEKLPLVIVGGRRNSKTLNYGIKLGRKQILQELLDTE